MMGDNQGVHFACCPLQCYLKKVFIFGQVLGGELGQLINVSLAGGQKRGDGGSAFIGDNVAMGAADLGDQTVSAKESPPPSDPSHAAWAFLFVALA